MKLPFLKKSMTTLAGLLCISTANLQAYDDFEWCNCFNWCPCYNLFVGAEGLYWTVDQRDLDYAIDVDASDGATEIVGPGHVHFLDYHYRGGVRFWVGFQGQNNWDLLFAYTSYRNNSHEDHTGTAGETLLLATLVHPAITNSTALSAELRSKLTYRSYDLLLGNQLSFYCEDFFVHPFIGVRGLTLDQHISGSYTGGDFGNTQEEIKFKSDLNAIGLHAGMGFDYQFCYGIGFYGEFAGSLLAGKTHNHQVENHLDANGDLIRNEVNFREHENVMIPGWSLKAGLSWNPCYAYEGINMICTIGYEFNQWFNTPQYRRFVNDTTRGVSCKNNGIIGLHGTTVSVTLFF